MGTFDYNYCVPMLKINILVMTHDKGNFLIK